MRMTKDQFERELVLHGHHLAQYWIHEELVDWLWGLLDPAIKEEERK